MRWNSTKSYTEDDIIKMQQEAVSRVQEFQERAQNFSFYDAPVAETAFELEPSPAIEVESHIVNPPHTPVHYPAATDPITGLLEKFNIDSEVLLILGLMFVLYNEKADSILLLGLAYLLL
ncbi:hypothetical protein V6615_15780 [Oscillospiraceae bacterium PP1C4]